MFGLMTANNQFNSITRMLADLEQYFFRKPEIFCRSFGTLETLGPKIKISRNYVLRASGDALEEAVLFYAGISLSVQVSGVETLQEGGSYGIFWNPGKAVRFCRCEGFADKG
jgi:hypothetical protein